MKRFCAVLSAVFCLFFSGQLTAEESFEVVADVSISHAIPGSFSPDGKRVAVLSDNEIKIFDAQTLEELGSLVRENEYEDVYSFSFSPDGKTIASLNLHHSSWAPVVRMWDVEQKKEVANYVIRNKFVFYSITFSPNGKLFAFKILYTGVSLWDIEKQQTVEEPNWDGEVNALTFSPDSRTLAYAGQRSGGIYLWDVIEKTGKKINSLQKWDSILSLAYSPDGKKIVAGGDDYMVRTYDVESRRELATFAGHGNGVKSVAFSPDGKTILSGSWDGTLRVWDADVDQRLPVEQALAVLSKPGGVIWAAFNPDGKTFVALHLNNPQLYQLYLWREVVLVSDFNGDGAVNFSDFIMFAGAFGSTNPQFDLNNSGKVDFADFLIFVGEFGPRAGKPVPLTPESVQLGQEALNQNPLSWILFNHFWPGQFLQPEAPIAWELSQNFPNPFNPETTISYSLMEPVSVTLQMFNIQGQFIRSLVNASQSTGRYSVIWDGKDELGRSVSSGVYVYRLDAGNFSSVKRLILLK